VRRRRDRASKADSRTRGRRSRSRRNARFTPDDWVIVERYLRMDWSPEQVSGFLRVEGIMRISYETIYLHVWADRRARGRPVAPSAPGEQEVPQALRRS